MVIFMKEDSMVILLMAMESWKKLMGITFKENGIMAIGMDKEYRD